MNELLGYAFPAVIGLISLYFYLNSKGIIDIVEFSDDKRRRWVGRISLLTMAGTAALLAAELLN